MFINAANVTSFMSDRWKEWKKFYADNGIPSAYDIQDYHHADYISMLLVVAKVELGKIALADPEALPASPPAHLERDATMDLGALLEASVPTEEEMRTSIAMPKPLGFNFLPLYYAVASWYAKDVDVLCVDMPHHAQLRCHTERAPIELGSGAAFPRHLREIARQCRQDPLSASQAKHLMDFCDTLKSVTGSYRHGLVERRYLA